MWSIVYNEETESHVTYNFNLGAGDTSSVYNAYLGYQKVYVNSVDSILIAGKYRKRLGIGFDPGTSIWEYWIEGIGSTTGLFYPACFIFDYGFLLSCTFYQDDLYHTFSEDGLCGCYKTDTYPREFDQTIEIYPVPVNDIIRIDIPYTLDHLSYAIFSLDGKNIDKNSIQPGTNEIDLSSCAPGSYVIILLSRNKKIMAKTIIAN